MALDDEFDYPNRTLTEREILDQNERFLNLSVSFLILTIFSFFFIIILVILCLQWLERKRSGMGEGCLLLPKGPVPGYVTVLSSDHPHMKLLGHYQLQPCYTKESWS